jgi:hypothetical protein
MTTAMPMDSVAVVTAFQARQDVQDLAGCIDLVAEGAVVDVGRGHYEGEEDIRRWLESTIFPIHTQTDELVVQAAGDDRVAVQLTLSDDNTRRLHLSPVTVLAEFVVLAGKIRSLSARPTPESLATVRTIQDALGRERTPEN